MRIEWDAALVAATAAALDARYSGARIRAVAMDADARRLTLYLREATLVWELHPERTGFRILEAMDPPPEARPLPARLRAVWAPPDDRVVVLEARRVRGRPARTEIVIELFPTRENIVVAEGEERTIRTLLRTREGDRTLRRGQPWVPPPASTRFGADDEPAPERWESVVGTPAPGRSDLVRSVAWTSPLVADSLLAEDGPALWQRLRSRVRAPDQATGPAAVVAGRHGPQPYPIALPGRTLAETADLLEAFAEADRLGDQSGPATLLPGALLQALDEVVERERGRVARLEEEFEGLADADGLQGLGDLLLARFHEIPDGASHVELEGFAGERVRVELDPTLSADANARRLYGRAAKVRRARAELPERIRAARERWRTLEELAARARVGDAQRDEIEAVLPGRPTGGKRAASAPTLPYRSYRSSGGLEIRVGRGAGRNDELTFKHARPGDIWLHARHTAGAHVVLRWDGEGAPPARDLEEAAVLAALASRARTSGSVPVDWTRRKYVRKPRRAPPGSVLPDRVKTVFVEPDPALEQRLRED